MITDRKEGDKVLKGNSGFLLIRDMKVYSINMMLKFERYEIRYQLTREDYFSNHGVDHLWDRFKDTVYTD